MSPHLTTPAAPPFDSGLSYNPPALVLSEPLANYSRTKILESLMVPDYQCHPNPGTLEKWIRNASAGCRPFKIFNAMWLKNTYIERLAKVILFHNLYCPLINALSWNQPELWNYSYFSFAYCGKLSGWCPRMKI